MRLTQSVDCIGALWFCRLHRIMVRGRNRGRPYFASVTVSMTSVISSAFDMITATWRLPF